MGTAAVKNTLVVLPTGMGKTGIALMLAAQRLKNYPHSKVLILAPTKPLVEQHASTFESHMNIPSKQFCVFTGSVNPEKRNILWDEATVIFSTPQVIENDVISGRISLRDVSLVVFDEAHRATGDYSYVFVSKQYNKFAKHPKCLALTASPGSDVEKIEEVCKNLFIESVEVRTDSDEDVKPYVQKVDFERVSVDLPQNILNIKIQLDSCKKQKVRDLRSLGVKIEGFLNKKEILRLQRVLQARMAKGDRAFEVLKGLSLVAEIVKVDHALELLETQGVFSTHKYMSSLFHDSLSSKVKAVRNLTCNSFFKAAFAICEKAHELGIEHPKVEKVKSIVSDIMKKDNAKVILFTQFRDTAVMLNEKIKVLDNVFPAIFVGQAKKNGTGLSQKKQAEVLDLFRDGAVNVLIATSVAEEGLDIPSVDAVLFYEPIPSAIRAIQRKGRTGRHEEGRIILFVTKGTRDEGYLWSSRSKEKKMVSILKSLQTSVTLDKPKAEHSQKDLASFGKPNESFTIFADYREKSTGVIKHLVDSEVNVQLKMLSCGDYVLSPRVGVELKTVPDFVSSIIDGRLLNQLKNLKNNFESPVIIIQGSEDIYSVRNVHPNAIRGMISTIAISYGIPIIQTVDDNDTAEFLKSIAKREISFSNSSFSPHADRKPVSQKDIQEYIVSSLPNIGPSLAKDLLKNFGSVRTVFSAKTEELKKVQGVGDKIASSIKDVLDKEY